MSERSLGALATACWVAALAGGYVPAAPWALRAGLGLAAAIAWRVKNPKAVAAILVALVLVQSSAAWSEIRVEFPPLEYVGPATLRSDPTPTRGGMRARLEVDGRIYDARAWGSPAGWMRNRLMGETLSIEATLRPSPDTPLWLRSQGVQGRASIRSIDAYTEGSVHSRLANSVRRTIEHGARSMDRESVALYTGLVYGDDRNQSPLTADNFAAAGLAHLVAVSGQNVAFLLAIASPVLRSLRPRGRIVAVLLVLLVFATMTRFEASVVRASTMAAIAATGALVGTAVPAQRVLTLTVLALVVVDPLLVHSVAFQLSLAASAGILFWSGRLGRAIPGPRPFIDALSVTVTAQLAVAPLLLWRFGQLPVASLPANLAAGPVAGPVMMWGMTAGWAAGFVPEWLATLIQVPTRFALWWISTVALVSAKVPLGSLGPWHLGACAGFGIVGLRSTRAAVRRLALGAVMAVLVLPALAIQFSFAASKPLPAGAILRDEKFTVVVIESADRAEAQLEALRQANVGSIDLLVAAKSSYAMADLVGWIDARHSIDTVWAPQATMGQGETIPDGSARVAVGGVMLKATISEGSLNLIPAAGHRELPG